LRKTRFVGEGARGGLGDGTRAGVFLGAGSGAGGGVRGRSCSSSSLAPAFSSSASEVGLVLGGTYDRGSISQPDKPAAANVSVTALADWARRGIGRLGVVRVMIGGGRNLTRGRLVRLEVGVVGVRNESLVGVLVLALMGVVSATAESGGVIGRENDRRGGGGRRAAGDRHGSEYVCAVAVTGVGGASWWWSSGTRDGLGFCKGVCGAGNAPCLLDA
jgi:hypothetical protein